MPIINLNQYSVHDSVRNSGVSFQSDRVRSMALVRVQYFIGPKKVGEDTTRREVKLY